MKEHICEPRERQSGIGKANTVENMGWKEKRLDEVDDEIRLPVYGVRKIDLLTKLID